ncbi:hypothetical protein Salat_2569900 [Sesamum alatum]|uniref:Uncharacterized protein n=1 Tax=Sesamum alatum TaxID=300844 RepID=A0AAE1XSV3_9LAMI|nr:hypothetical protein Salat_2569900 [Sesamum alatum]
MFRALSTRRSRRGYEHLADEASTPAPALLLPDKLSRAKSLPAKLFSSSKKSSSAAAAKINIINAPCSSEQVVVKKASKVHPLFSLFETSLRRKKKATAKPEFSRYLEYVREGGVWDVKQNMPVIYYK